MFEISPSDFGQVGKRCGIEYLLTDGGGFPEFINRDFLFLIGSCSHGNLLKQYIGSFKINLKVENPVQIQSSQLISDQAANACAN
jgi:hypothetical protein